MSEVGLKQAQNKMSEAGVNEQARAVFSHYYRALEEGVTGYIAEESIDPMTDPDLLSSTTVTPDAAQDALAATVIIKLNGGLGTSMGMDKAKSLLPVRDGRSFLDLIVGQVQHARASYGVKLPLLFMNSFRTCDDTRAALAGYHDLDVDGLGLDFLQSQEPKLGAADLCPVEWPADPTLEWCPPGHGDLYPALLSAGVLERLVTAGYRYASVSNSDNLGAAPNATIAGWFAASGAPYAAEVCRRTPADRKGGHLAFRKADGQLILRDTAQTSEDDMHYFTDEHRHPYFHTNNVWFDLLRVLDTLRKRQAVLGLPLIKNLKTVDPADPTSTEVIQIESAMGAAVEVFEGATAIGVGRERFLPVKTTNDLLVLRSDVYELTEDHTLTRVADLAPDVQLDPQFYQTIGAFESRFTTGAPSLKAAGRFTVHGDWSFGAGVTVIGDVELLAGEGPQTIPAGSTLMEQNRNHQSD